MFAPQLPQFHPDDIFVTKTGTLTPIWLRVLNTFRQSLQQQASPVLFKNLPSPPTTGMVFAITDSTVNTWGSTVAGGGANTVLCWWNGSHWTVVGA